MKILFLRKSSKNHPWQRFTAQEVTNPDREGLINCFETRKSLEYQCDSTFHSITAISIFNDFSIPQMPTRGWGSSKSELSKNTPDLSVSDKYLMILKFSARSIERMWRNPQDIWSDFTKSRKCHETRGQPIFKNTPKDYRKFPGLIKDPKWFLFFWDFRDFGLGFTGTS